MSVVAGHLVGGATLTGTSTAANLIGGAVLTGIPDQRTTAADTRVRGGTVTPLLITPVSTSARRRRLGVARPAPYPTGVRRRSGTVVPSLHRHIPATGVRHRGGFCVVVRVW